MEIKKTSKKDGGGLCATPKSNNTEEAKQKKYIKITRKISSTLDYIILFASIALLVIGGYFLWDRKQVYEAASPEQFIMYKPTKDNKTSYETLTRLNPDVIGWIDIYGTKIDYPLVQARDNWAYLNQTVSKEYSTGGSIFLDYRNRRDLTDFNHVIYGHHMAERKMFGDIDRFEQKDFFDKHRYGVIHRTDLPSLGVDFFAFVKTHGADTLVLTPALQESQKKQALISYVKKNAILQRPMHIGEGDRLVFLDTCDLSVTNGRYILVGKLTDKIPKNTFHEKIRKNPYIGWSKKVENIDWFGLLIVLWLILVVIYWIYERYRKRKEEKRCIGKEKI